MTKIRFFRGPARRMLLMTLLLMALRPLLARLTAYVPGAEDQAMRYAILTLHSAALWGLPALLMRPWRSDALPHSEKTGGACAAALLLGITAQLAMSPVTLWWSELLGMELHPMPMPENEVQWMLAVLALCLTPAVCEEAFFRGSVLTGMTMSGQKWSALAMTTLLFALMHGSLAGLPGHLTVSLLSTLLMLRWGKLRVCVLMHLGYNAASLLTGALPLDLRVSAPLGIVLAASAMWTAGGVSWYSRRRLNLINILLCLIALLGAGAAYLPELLGL
ncbi:MAG: CPBP family intramembrane metalloprotease [Clostridia bacterium]|nr:CPBP family intramembrane metalloprotease [Clostridia bacterium]